MMKQSFTYVSGLLGITALLVLPLQAAEEFAGRWDVTETQEGRSFASWLSITHQEGPGWKALYLHRGGHPLPCEVQVEGNQIQVKVVPESHYSGPADRTWPTLTGSLSGDRLEGTGTDRRGNEFSWEARRAPDRLEGWSENVRWGKPIELFNGRDIEGWQTLGNRESKWKAVDGILTNEATGANLRTNREFRDFKLHVEFKIPEGSNSGIYLRGRYESQVADDYGKEPYIRMVGGIYGQIAPLVNATKPAGEWNVLDATLVGYRVTIVLNGQTTVDGQLISGITGGALSSDERAPGPIMLQGDHGPVYYRNIVLTPAE